MAFISGQARNRYAVITRELQHKINGRRESKNAFSRNNSGTDDLRPKMMVFNWPFALLGGLRPLVQKPIIGPLTRAGSARRTMAIR